MKLTSKPVQLEGVTKTFSEASTGKEVVAVEDSNLSVQPGELVTLLGPSGCGKTTTLRMIGGFETPSRGIIRIGSEDVTYLPPNKRDTAMVFQSYGLFPHMSVFDNVAYGLKLRKCSREEIRRRVTESLTLVGLEHLGERAPGRLSGGQQQRVALARSLIVEPGVLLLDEPLSNLDALLREQMRVEIRKIQKNLGITAVYVTHDRVEAMSLSDRIVVMHQGRIVQTGTPFDIYSDPISPFVAGFVGKAAFFEGEVLGKDAENCTLKVRGHAFSIPRFSKNLKPGDPCLLMCRPESMEILEPGEGILDGVVTTNIYLGHSMETFVRTSENTEILVQIDDPGAKKIYPEGSHVSVTVNPRASKVLCTNREGSCETE